MSFSSLAFLPVLADLLLAPAMSRTTLSKPYRLAPFNVRNLRSWLNSVHSVFELRNVGRRIILVKFHNLNIQLHDRIHELERKIKSLEVELKQSNMARDAYDYMIDLAEKTYNIPVRKNSGAK